MKPGLLLLAAVLLTACQQSEDPDTPVTPQESGVRDKANADVNAAISVAAPEAAPVAAPVAART